MSHLEEKHPWHASMLKWHRKKVNELYPPKMADVLYSKAQDWVVRDLRFHD
jgi:hypothetical protein